ncbi:rubrerythrin domain-containing protein [Haematococcus lacustris]|uniref:magnesium-protoporphyrin IX monomethyl ester (oxidative) cyclase n=1 Tax=Haematococcus lacustris TaxID=44745 RepID=A0A699ZIW3_HAELA|nr:rubrerythrin domain-containing protein [Haematococcus lacustris]
MRDGIKVAAEETLLTPRFYTTDFDEMERLFSKEINPNINMEELNACLAEFRQDYNKKHFVRNQTFAPAAAAIQGPTRKIFIEFLERSCTAEFSGFLLYKELARRLKDSAPEVAEMFLLTSRDEARHAGFINKALSDFNLALDLGFMTKNRTYTFFKPKFIIYATFLSEKIGYWRYISIYRHLQRNPDCQLYPLFEYFESWCQDENRHGDFLAAILKAKPELLQGWEAKLWSRFFCLSVYITMYLNDHQVPGGQPWHGDFLAAILKAKPELLQGWEAKLWSRFFCLSVYITMYLNDHQRTTFYESLGMNTTQFNRHVILETNRSTERLFPQVPDVESPVFWERMDRLLELTAKLRELDGGSLPAPLKAIARLPILERLIANMLQIFLISPKDCGSRDLESSIANLAV